MIRVLVWCEHEQDRIQEDVKAAYPEYMHNAIAGFLKEDPNLEVRTATLQDDPETCGITDEVLAETDVILWWGHIKHHAVPEEFSRQGYWSGLPFPSSGDLPDPGITPGSPALQTDSLSSAPPGKLQGVAKKKKKGKKKENCWINNFIKLPEYPAVNPKFLGFLAVRAKQSVFFAVCLR